MSPLPTRLRALARGTPLLRDLYDAQWHLRRHHRRTGHWANPLRPRTLNDWVMRRLILAHDPLHARMSDKLALRALVRERLGDGEDPCVPLLGTWDDTAALARDWDTLPAAFVLKPNHGSGMVRLIRDRAREDRDAALAEAAGWLRTSFYETGREWGYRGIRPRLLAEPMVPPHAGEDRPRDLRLFVFDGEVALLRVNAVQGGEVVGTCFDAALRRIELLVNGRAEGDLAPPTAAQYRAMCAIAGPLCAGWDFVRADFLARGAGDHVWLGELTPYPDAGTAPFEPREWAVWLGDVWRATRAGRPWPPMPA